MPRFLAGAALTALMTLVLASVLGARTYVPVVASGTGLTETAQQAPPTPTPIVLTYPVAADKPIDGPLALDLTFTIGAAIGIVFPASIVVTATLTNAGAPLSGQYVPIYAFDGLDYARVSGNTDSNCGTTTGCYVGSFNRTDASGHTTSSMGIVPYHRGTTVLYTATATYNGRSVLVTRRVLIQ